MRSLGSVIIPLAEDWPGAVGMALRKALHLALVPAEWDAIRSPMGMVEIFSCAVWGVMGSISCGLACSFYRSMLRILASVICQTILDSVV